MNHMKELDAIIGELDAAASVAQTKGGSLSWRKAREIAFRLATATLGKVLIPEGSHDYLKDHHQITSSGIGLAKMALLRNNPLKAMEYLQKISADIDDSIIKHLPHHHAALQQLRPVPETSPHA